MERLYWKGRKIKNAVLFKIKAFFHKRRDEQESKKDDLLFEKSVVKEVIKASRRLCKYDYSRGLLNGCGGAEGN